MRGYFLQRSGDFPKELLNEKGQFWNDFPRGFGNQMRVLGIKPAKNKETAGWSRCLKTLRENGRVAGYFLIRTRREDGSDTRYSTRLNDYVQTIIALPFPIRDVVRKGRSWFLGHTKLERKLVDAILDETEEEPCFDSWGRLYAWEAKRIEFATMKMLTKRAFTVHFIYDDSLYLFKKSGSAWKAIYLESGKKFECHLSSDKKMLTVVAFKLTEPPTGHMIRLRSGKANPLSDEVTRLLVTSPKPLMEG